MKPESVKFPPRGWVSKKEWFDIDNRCDPGDGFRPCGVHFIPHIEYQMPFAFQVMAVEEHNHITKELHDGYWQISEECKQLVKLRQEDHQLIERLRVENKAFREGLQRVVSRTHSWVIEESSARFISPHMDSIRAIAKEALAAGKEKE